MDFVYVCWVEWGEEVGLVGVGVEFGVGVEQWQCIQLVVVDVFVFVVEEYFVEWCFGVVLQQYVVFFVVEVGDQCFGLGGSGGCQVEGGYGGVLWG